MLPRTIPVMFIGHTTVILLNFFMYCQALSFPEFLPRKAFLSRQI
jgi:hypothetical protein